MKHEKIRELIRNQPFKPFSVYLPEGREVRIWHHDFARLSPEGRTLVVFDKNGGMDLIDVMLISSIRIEVFAEQQPANTM